MEMAFTVRLLLLLIPSFFGVPISVFSQTDGKVAVDAYLSATAGNNSSWLSPSGDFAFGFRQLENKDLFLLSIWYAKIPDRTIVWYANGDSPVAPKGSLVNLTANDGLVLTSPQGQQLWKSETIVGVVAFGVLNDTGNFVLEDDNSESLWETFKNPTHTMLPGQDIEKGGKLSSQQSETNFSKGRFQLRMQDDGNLVLNSINLPTEFANKPYYASGTTGESNSSTAGTKLEFNSSGYMYVLRENGQKFNLKAQTVSARSYYLRATINFDGVFAQYSYPKNSNGNGSWSLVWSLPDNICRMEVDSGLGVCGYNSVCTLKSERPTCECPSGFSLLDSNDPYGDCKPDFIQGCEEDEPSPTKDIYEVQTVCVQLLSSTMKPVGKRSYLFQMGDWIASLIHRPLSKSGKVIQLYKFLNYHARMIRRGKNQTTLIRVGSALLGTSIFVNFMFSAMVCLGFLVIYRKKHGKSNQHVLGSNLRSFSYEELEEATNGFKEELGKGSFGVVYKGILQIGSGVQVAVKKLNFVVQDSEKEFKTELNIIGQTHHKNLVRLVGYCDEEQQRLLVYEFLSNGTLASFLFGDAKPSWRQRIDVAFGVARGLLYLHEECSTQIIHCDIKPQNILLDDYYNAQIADFGLAKLLMMNQSKTHTAIRGTKGYVAPEWFRNMAITTKVDVYSFGVVLLEVICCRRSVDMETGSDESAILTDWVYDCYHDGVLDAVVDYEVEPLQDKTKLERFVMVAIWCIQEDPSLRPTMRKVVQMLEGVVEVHVPPCPSPYSRTG
ncbi:hypothetical protein M0R45_036683 [Rubus argutus]|uniref:Receptor-like serine/threonine-protein kinase n=1 Tax=Rubus argutus TaxID=59490 RepID=A0AAW1VYL0_RUBAR